MEPLKITEKEFAKTENIIWSNKEDVLEIIFSFHLNKFLVFLNSKVMGSFKSLRFSLFLFNRLARERNISPESQVTELQNKTKNNL